MTMLVARSRREHEGANETPRGVASHATHGDILDTDAYEYDSAADDDDDEEPMYDADAYEECEHCNPSVQTTRCSCGSSKMRPQQRTSKKLQEQKKMQQQCKTCRNNVCETAPGEIKKLGQTVKGQGSIETKGSVDVEETEEQIMFSCNICYELASEPVVTLCGHLYCWPCLFRWLQVQSNCRTCPVCKAGVDRDKVIPVYGRGGNEDPRAKTIESSHVPARPTGQRPQPVDNRLLQTNVIGGPHQNFGMLPNIFGFSYQGHGFQDQISPEQQHQAFLSSVIILAY